MNNDLIKLELFIAKVLRRGVLIAGSLILVGWLMQIDLQRNIFLEYSVYQEVSLKQALIKWAQLKEWGVLIIYFGLLVLISLPLIRVLLTGILFLKQKDYAMTGIVILVLGGLILSVALGFDV